MPRFFDVASDCRVPSSHRPDIPLHFLCRTHCGLYPPLTDQSSPISHSGRTRPPPTLQIHTTASTALRPSAIGFCTTLNYHDGRDCHRKSAAQECCDQFSTSSKSRLGRPWGHVGWDDQKHAGRDTPTWHGAMVSDGVSGRCVRYSLRWMSLQDAREPWRELSECHQRTSHSFVAS